MMASKLLKGALSLIEIQVSIVRCAAYLAERANKIVSAAQLTTMKNRQIKRRPQQLTKKVLEAAILIAKVS